MTSDRRRLPPSLLLALVASLLVLNLSRSSHAGFGDAQGGGGVSQGALDARAPAPTTSGYVLTSNGVGLAPTYQAAAGGGGLPIVTAGEGAGYPIRLASDNALAFGNDTTTYLFRNGSELAIEAPGGVTVSTDLTIDDDLTCDDITASDSMLLSSAAAKTLAVAVDGTGKFYVSDAEVIVNATLLANADVAVVGSVTAESPVYAWSSGAPTTLADTATKGQTYYLTSSATASGKMTLPSAAAGLHATWIVGDTDGWVLTAASGDTIRVSAAVSGTAGTCTSTTVGSTVHLVAVDATQWIAVENVGTWTLSP